MDTSETYIKMCEKAEEIQSIRSLRPGDIAFYEKEKVVLVLVLASPPFPRSWYIEHGKEYGIWLPRQDQLQSLSGLGWRNFDKECLKIDAETKEQAGIQVVLKNLPRGDK